MPHLHIFNPENDFALALGRRAYTPDKGASAIRRAGCLLPLWWAEPGDAVLIDSADSELLAQAERLKESFGLNGHIVSRPPEGFIPDPWGWSHHLRRQLICAGVDPRLLPSDDYLDRLRMLSHRRTAVAVNRLIGTSEALMPAEVDSPEEALAVIDNRHRGNAVVKLPWSSSGRGVIYAGAIPRPTLETYIRGMIRRQGSVTIEPLYDRVRDFAMLFEATEAGVEYRGLSTFQTDERGFYAGNIAAPQPYIASLIGADTTPLIAPLREALARVIAPVGYRGWIGVDMLTHRSPSASAPIAIAPCIEINFRRTMGVAALHAAHRLSSPALLTHAGLK